MEPLEIIEIAREAVWVLLKCSLPIMLVALVVGLIVSLFQALTQIQEMTLAFVPKIIAIFISLIVLLPYLHRTLATFTEQLGERIAGL